MSVAILSCGPVPFDRAGAFSFNMNFPGNPLSKSITDPSVDPASLVCAFGIMGHQSGILTAGYSADTNTTMGYFANVTGPDGTVFGSNATTETFMVSDPSVINLTGLPAGATLTPYMTGSNSYDVGIFMVRFGGDKSTVLKLTKATWPFFSINKLQGNLSMVDEVVLRTCPDYINGNVILLNPHFIYRGC